MPIWQLALESPSNENSDKKIFVVARSKMIMLALLFHDFRVPPRLIVAMRFVSQRLFDLACDVEKFSWASFHERFEISWYVATYLFLLNASIEIRTNS